MASPQKRSNRYSRLVRATLELLAPLLTSFAAAVEAVHAVSTSLGVVFAVGVKVALGITGPVFVGITNYALLYAVRAIFANKDNNNRRPTAIVIAVMVLVALIAAYAGIYLLEMPAAFEGLHPESGFAGVIHKILGAIYFSATTITTLGYGDITPIGDLARLTAAVEALNGLIAFGLFTGAVTGFVAASAIEKTPARTTVLDKGETNKGEGQDGQHKDGSG